MSNNFFITTAIPFVNARPHIGFALELIQADIIARSQRERGNNTLFLTGTDENSIKNVQAAEKAGIPVQKLVDENAATFVELAKVLSVSNDDFIRTTEPRHVAGAVKLWEACKKSGDIYEKEYEGLYCSGCEQFYLEKDLIGGLCPEHKTKPELVKEINYFFNLKKYEPWLKEAFARGELRIHPKSRQNETTSFINEGLQDFSISRSNERAKNWGIPVPGDNTQMIYVWFDALSNYVNALDYEAAGDKFQKFWMGDNSRITHVIGKGITKFHAIYWPAMLQSAGIFPKNGLDIFVHGYVTVNGEKISKSLGNTVDPFDLVNKYGADAVRYFLLREIPTFEDGDFSTEKFVQRYNSNLANGIGNFVQRVTTLAQKYGISKLDGSEFADAVKNAEGSLLHASNGNTYQIGFALQEIMGLVKGGDGYMEKQAPYKKERTAQEREHALSSLLYLTAEIARLLRPFMPNTSKLIFERLGIGPKTGLIDPSTIVNVKKGDPLFQRIS
jgi:methionyl-tRNA synthetase